MRFRALIPMFENLGFALGYGSKRSNLFLSYTVEFRKCNQNLGC